MAYSRCLVHHSPPKTRTRPPCTKYAYPVGYPNSALICGIPYCTNQGVIWLDSEEQLKYQSGIRIFAGPNNNFTKMKASDKGLFVL